MLLEAMPGRTTVFVGANGSGKSAMGLWLQRNSQGVETNRLIAHRRLWLEHAGPNITASQRDQHTQNLTTWDLQEESRWLDHANSTRASVALFDLIAAHNARNDRLARQFDDGVAGHKIRAGLEPSPISQLNKILDRCGLLVQIQLTETASLHAARNEGSRYPISHMSDGEKNATLLAAEILTAAASSIQIIDEPERHMHRSISAPLMEAVADERPDCHFAILTHDLDLARSLVREGADAVVLNGCTWSNGVTDAWDAHQLCAADGLPDTVRSAILGGRGRVLFIEGTRSSLDFRLLRLLCPGWALEPIGGSSEVIRATKGLTASSAYHWIEAAGVVDGDRRTSKECAALRSHGVFSLGVHEIESVYYSAPVLRRLAEIQAPGLEQKPEDLLNKVRANALKSLSEPGTLDHLAAVVATAEIRRHLVEAAPPQAQVAADPAPIELSLENPFLTERQRLERLVNASDLDAIVARYPVRDSGFRGRVVESLGYTSADQLQAAVRHQLTDDEVLLAAIRKLAGPLPGANQSST